LRAGLALFLAIVCVGLMGSCAGVTSSKDGQPSTGPSSQSIVLSPATVTVRAGTTQSLTATVTGFKNAVIAWSVNGVQNGNLEVGTIASTGEMNAVYTAPSQIPSLNPATITASVGSSSPLSTTTTATILNSVPQLSSIAPPAVGIGPFTITVLGNGFANGATVNFGATTLQTNFVSSTKLTTTGTATSSQSGLVAVSVTNPNPGSVTSGSLNIQVSSAPPEAPLLSASPSTITLPTGGTAKVTLVTSGTPEPTLACSVEGEGGAQLSGSIVTYTAPTTVPEGGQATIACTATNAGGATTVSVKASILASIAEYTGPVPSTYFGMHYISPSNWPAVSFGAQGKMPGTLWPNIEPTSGQFSWALLDKFVNDAKAHGIGVMYSTAGVPPWAVADPSTCQPDSYGSGYTCSGNVSNLADWDAFVTALVTRYKGQIQIYELWNEPQDDFTGTVAQLVALTQHEHDIIRTLDPTATILSPSIPSWGYQYMDDYFAAGGTQDVDAVAMHMYPNPNNDIAETVVGSASSTLRTVMAKYGLAGKPMWDTEGGWGYASKGAITDPNLRAAFVARDYLLQWSMGISRLYWYAWDDPNIGTLWAPGAPPSQAAIAYQQVLTWMNGAVLVQACSNNGATSPYNAIYTCELTRGGGYDALAVWNTEGDSVYAVPSQFLHYRDLSGNVYSVPGDHEVTIGLKPILLENF
jgi:hypothetical protein